MTKHIITGSFALFYGDAGAEWAPDTAGQPTWTVLVVEFTNSHVGKTGVSDTTHISSAQIDGQRLALVANWGEDASSGDFSVEPATDFVYCKGAPGALSDGARNALSKLLRGSGSGKVTKAEKEGIFSLLGAMSPDYVKEANINVNGAANLGAIAAGNSVRIVGVGTLTIPAAEP